MASKKLREDKTCQNCGEYVEKSFCPECGQKNTESRRSFYGLFIEFFAGITSYDSSFWKTIRYLFFSPAKLSQEYMAGKRKSYLAPVQLYLFVSFIAFLVPSLLPTPEGKENDLHITPELLKEKGMGIDQDHEKYGFVRSKAHLDSIHNSLPEENRISKKEYFLMRVVIRLNRKVINPPTFEQSFKSTMVDNLSKVVFIYMPVFAFLLWLFHNKKRWYYFDNGVFTLHFFSFIMLLSTFLAILYCILIEWLDQYTIFVLTVITSLLYVTFYFFRAHHLFYEEKRYISRLKATVLVIINTTFICILSVLYLLVSLLI